MILNVKDADKIYATAGIHTRPEWLKKTLGFWEKTLADF